MQFRRLYLTPVFLLWHCLAAQAQLPWAWASTDANVKYDIGAGFARSALAAGRTELLWGTLQQERQRKRTNLFGEYRIARLDTNGKLLSSVLLNGSIRLRGARADADGNWYILGSVLDSLQIGNGPVLQRANPVIEERFLIRLHAGTLALDWHFPITAPAYGSSDCFSVSETGVYLPLDSISGSTILHLDLATGTINHRITHTGYSEINAVVADAAGNVYVLGQCADVAGIDFNGRFSVPGAGITRPHYVVRYKPDGTYDWHLWMQGDGCIPLSLALAPDSGLILSGNNTKAFALDTVQIPSPSPGTSDYFLAKLSGTGRTLWMRSYPRDSRFGPVTFGDYRQTAVTDQMIYLFAIGDGPALWGPGVTTSNAGPSATVVGYDATGGLRWAKNIRGAQSAPQQIVTIGSSIYLAGLGYDSIRVSFDNISIPTPNIPGRYLFIPFLAKLGHTQPTGITPPAANQPEFQYSPNPSDGQLKMISPYDADVSILDFTGRSIWSGRMMRDAPVTLSTSSWPRGMYLISVLRAQENRSFHLIVR